MTLVANPEIGGELVSMQRIKAAVRHKSMQEKSRVSPPFTTASRLARPSLVGAKGGCQSSLSATHCSDASQAANHSKFTTAPDPRGCLVSSLTLPTVEVWP